MGSIVFPWLLTLAKARQVNLVEANAILHDSARTLAYFQVAAVNLKAKRQVKTSSYWSIHRMAYPASVQWFTPWGFPGGQCDSQVELLRDGWPKPYDILDATSCPILLGGLRRWTKVKHMASDVIEVDEPVSLANKDWNYRKRVPLCVVVETLYRQGWTDIGQVPMLHGVTSPKIFAVKDLWSRWAYLQCLVLLPEFWAKAPFELPSQAEAKYYECVLQADRPMDIPLDKTAKHYARWLSGGVEAQADAAEEKVNGHALVFFPIVSFDDITIEKAKPAKRASPCNRWRGYLVKPRVVTS